MLSFEQVVAGHWSLMTTLQPIHCDWDARVNEAFELDNQDSYTDHSDNRIECLGNLTDYFSNLLSYPDLTKCLGNLVDCLDKLTKFSSNYPDYAPDE